MFEGHILVTITDDIDQRFVMAIFKRPSMLNVVLLVIAHNCSFFHRYVSFSSDGRLRGLTNTFLPLGLI